MQTILRFRFGSLSLLMLVVSSMGAVAANSWFSGYTFKILLPNGARVDKSPGPDFIVYTFSNRGTPLFSIYEGYAPTFPREGKVPPTLTQETINKEPVRVATWPPEKNGARSREFLFDIPSSGHSSLRALDIWYDELPDSSAREAEAVIGTIKRVVRGLPD